MYDGGLPQQIDGVVTKFGLPMGPFTLFDMTGLDVCLHVQNFLYGEYGERFKPAAVIDLATLTGAVIIALGHENAGVFSNDDKLADAVLKAAKAEGEGAWRLPLAPAYDKLIDSRLADIKNTGGRPAGSITAAQFLQRFIEKDMPWVHLDIAGVALPPGETAMAPKGATGWGVMTLNRMIRDQFEG